MTTASDIRTALRGVFPTPEWLLGFEVRNGAGFDANRSIDAQAINTWPSRGLEVVAVEIKVSRSDFQREMKDPSKVEEGAAYADRIALATPKGLIAPEELPKGWGLIEVNGDGKGRWKVKAAQKPAMPADRALLVTMLRSFGGDIEGEIKRRNREERDRMDREFKARLDREVARRTQSLEAHAKKREHIDEWLKEQGFAYWCSDDEIKAAVRIARHSRVGGGGMYDGGGLPGLRKELEVMAKRMAEAMAEHGIDA